MPVAEGFDTERAVFCLGEPIRVRLVFVLDRACPEMIATVGLVTFDGVWVATQWSESQNLGAGRPDRAEKSVWLTGVYSMIFLGLLSVVFIVFARPIIALFHQDPGVVAQGVDCLRIISYGYIFYAWGMVTVQCFNGAGDTWTPTWIKFFCFWLCQIPLAYYLATAAGMGPRGIYWAIAISYSISAVVGLVFFRRGRWKLRQV